MVQIRDINGVSGTVFDLAHAMSLSRTDCNVLFVSSRTLFFLQLFGTGEMDFLSRYASQFLPGNKYILAGEATEFDDINELINNYELEVQPVTCDIVSALNGIQQAITSTGANACACGTVGETLETTGGVPGGAPPEGFGEPDPAVVDRLCKAANAIHASILAAVIGLRDDSPVGFITLGFGVVSGLVSALLAATFIPVVGLLVVSVAGVVIAVTLALLASGLDIDTLSIDLDDFTDFLVCALFEAASAQDAIDAYLFVLSDSGQSAVNVALIRAMMTLNVANLLWFSTPDSEAFLDTYVPIFNCSSCAAGPAKIWTYPTDNEGWTFVDESTGGSSASVAYDAGDESLEVTVTTANEFFVCGQGMNISPAVSIPVAATGRIEVDHSGSSDPPRELGLLVRAIYDDASEYEQNTNFDQPGTATLNFSAAGTLVSVEVRIRRCTGDDDDGSTASADIFEVRVYSS